MWSLISQDDGVSDGYNDFLEVFLLLQFRQNKIHAILLIVAHPDVLKCTYTDMIADCFTISFEESKLFNFARQLCVYLIGKKK